MNTIFNFQDLRRPARPRGVHPTWRLLASCTFGIFVGFFVLAQGSIARPQHLEPNIREACRQVLTGAYITAYDDKERQRHFVRILKEKLAENQNALTKSHNEYQDLKDKKTKNTYDSSLTENTEAAYSAWRIFEDQKKELETQLSQALTEHEQAVAREKKLRQELEKILTIKRFEDRPDGGYPIETFYKSPCPPYRALCRLSEKDREILSKIRIDGELPVECQRYLSLGRMPSPLPQDEKK
jgi:hypothetical protein